MECLEPDFLDYWLWPWLVGGTRGVDSLILKCLSAGQKNPSLARMANVDMCG